MRQYLLAALIILIVTTISEARYRAYGVGFSVGGGILTGTFEKEPNPGFGFKGFFGFGLSDNFEIHTSFGWYTFTGDTDPEEDDPEDIVYQNGGTYIALPWAFGVRYYLVDSDFKPYVMANGAINFNKYTAPKKLNADNSVSGGESISVTKFGYNVGIGTLYKIGRHTDLELAALYNSVLDDQRGKFISLELGINWSF
jgi:hypothetical protein